MSNYLGSDELSALWYAKVKAWKDSDMAEESIADSLLWQELAEVFEEILCKRERLKEINNLMINHLTPALESLFNEVRHDLDNLTRRRTEVWQKLNPKPT